MATSIAALPRLISNRLAQVATTAQIVEEREDIYNGAYHECGELAARH